MSAPKLLVLAGTTAVGKTDVSIPLAEMLEGEIVSADSRQIFRELEIGTAKPTAAQRARVVHHFIDELSIQDRWTAGDFASAARQRIAEILSRRRTPLVVGGSMLYLRALLDGFYDEPDAAGIDYEALRAEQAACGTDVLYAELQQLDPVLAARTAPRDHHRILRGLAVARGGGSRLSDLQASESRPIAHVFRLYFLVADRGETYERVNQRARQMLADGLVDEVQRLYALGLDDRKCNALQTHGYQEVFPYLRGEITYEQMLEAIQKAVRHYVKRQVTWFRRESRAVWITRSFTEPPEAVAQRIVAEFRKAAV